MASRLHHHHHHQVTTKRSTCGVKVNHLPQGTSEGQLRTFFEEFGDIASVSIKPGTSECYAFVNFTSRSCAITAAEKTNGTTFLGKTINCRVQGNERRSSSVGEYTVKVSSLSKNISEDRLTSIFSLGDPSCVQSVRKINLSSSGPCYAYVNYYSQSDANRAVQTLDCFSIDGSQIRVKLHPNPLDSPVDKKQMNYPGNPNSAVSRQMSTSIGIPPRQIQHVVSLPAPMRQSSSRPLGSVKAPSRQSSAPQPSSLHYTQSSPDLPHSRRHFSYYPPGSPNTVLEPSHPSQNFFGTSNSRSLTGHSPHSYSSPRLINPQSTSTGEGAPLRSAAAVGSSAGHLSRSVKVSFQGALSADDIEKTFAQVGPLLDKPVIRAGDPPHAFVNFSTPEAAQEACHISSVNEVSVHVKRQAPRKKIEANLGSVDVPCTSLVASILSTKCQSELERLASEQNVKLMANPTRKCITILGPREQIEAVKVCLHSLLDNVKSRLSSKECELPCHSVPFFKQDSATEKVQEIQQTHGVEFRILRASDSNPVDLGSFAEDIKQCFRDEGSSDVPKCSDLSQYLTEKERETSMEPDAPVSTTWLWENDSSTGFIAYTPEITSELNKAYSISPLGRFSVKIGSFSYAIDFSTMTQTNSKTGRSRAIKRAEGGVEVVKWFYQDDRKHFQPFESGESDRIESAYQSNPSGFPQINGHFFKFAEMQELNLTTCILRKIERRVDVATTEELVTPVENVLTLHAAGLPENIDASLEDFHDILDQSTIEKKCHLNNHDYSKDFKAKLVKNMNQYFVTTELVEDCLKLKGTPNYVERVNLKAEHQILEMMKGMGESGFKTPSHWSPQTKEVKLDVVKRGSKEWMDEVEKIRYTLKGVTIVRLERVQNKWLWERYSFAKKRMDKRNRGYVNEKHLFHGTRKTSPEDVYKSEKGVDFRYSREGLWGTGAYFAVKASYSDSYAYRTPGGMNEKQMFICKVLAGESYDAGANTDRTLIQPPLKPGQDAEEKRYDSVKGHTNGSDVYIVYDHEKVYPAYLVTYRSA